MPYCKICGSSNCKKHSILLPRAISATEFSGSSPPEVFVGRWNYPNVYTGILSPNEHGDTEIMSSPELWHSKQLQIPKILSFREKLIYGRFVSNIKKPSSKFLSVLQEIAMTHKSISTAFKLKKPISQHKEKETRAPLIKNAAPIESVKLQENTKIKKKIDYLVNDREVKSQVALSELYKSKIPVSSLIKVLSAGLLGLKKNRKLVPTRWSITAVDSGLSEEKIKKIKYYPLISEFQVFHNEYLGNHYEIILLPRFWSFEVLEISLKNYGIWKDYESIFKRKTYAKDVTGAYYANRLAVTEYLDRIKRQASVLIFREILPSYNVPLGVGILRENSRGSFQKPGTRHSTLSECFQEAQTRLQQPIENFISKSELLKDLQQTTLNQF